LTAGGELAAAAAVSAVQFHKEEVKANGLPVTLTLARAEHAKPAMQATKQEDQ
jgi:hypothetical protein